MEVRANKLYWAKVRPNAIIPTKNREDAGYDIYACFDEAYIMIPPHTTASIPTGIACAVRDKYYLQVQERGSTGSIGMKYGAGVIDSSYRGEIFIVITNTNDVPIVIASKEKMSEVKLSEENQQPRPTYWLYTQYAIHLLFSNIVKIFLIHFHLFCKSKAAFEYPNAAC